jgi:RNA polymerase sigma-70 factor (ECF subfamily)
MTQDQGSAKGEKPDTRLFEELALPHLKALYRLAFRLIGEATAAEDLVQETYLKAIQGFASLRSADSIRPWLFQILSRLATDRYRSTRNEVSLDEAGDLDRFSLYDQIADEDPFPYSTRLHDDFLAQFQDDDVRRALEALPEVYRIPVVLVYTEEMSYKELAEVLGCPVGTVMSRLYRARKILERELWECAKRRGLVKTWNR